MPEKEIVKRGGAVRYRTIVVGRGKKKRVIHVAIVRKRGPHGGHTVAGPPRKLKGSG